MQTILLSIIIAGSLKLPLVVIAISIAMVGLAISMYYIRKRLMENGIECTGTIVDYRGVNQGKTPIIEFVTLTGEVIKREPYVYSSLTSLPEENGGIGQPVAIIYDPKKPKKFAIINGEIADNTTSLLFIIIALIFILGSICIMTGLLDL